MPRKTCETRTLRLTKMQNPPVPKSWICPRIGLRASRPVPCRATRRRARRGFAGNLRCLRLFNSARFFSIDTMDSPFAEPVKRTEFQAGIGWAGDVFPRECFFIFRPVGDREWKAFSSILLGCGTASENIELGES